MFRDLGSERSHRQNRRLAGCLAAIAGFVNSSGFVLIGSFTSHVTGNVGRFASDLASSELSAAAAAGLMVAAFFAGAFISSVIIESRAFSARGRSYAAALAIEAVLILAFVLTAIELPTASARVRDGEGVLLCAAMGMQNALVTRLSGAVVRTTHLTGAITDLGVELARWWRWSRVMASHRLHLKLHAGEDLAERPSPEKIALLVTIVGAFTLGALFGALGTLGYRELAMLLPALLVIACSIYAFSTSGAVPDAGSRK